MLARLTFMLTLVAAPLAQAQEAPVATAEQIAAAHAIAAKLIRDAGAEGIFVDKTTGASAEVEHLASGLRCTFSGSPNDRIAVFPSIGGVPRGDDVGCTFYDDTLRIDLSLYATRYRPLPEEAVVLADASRAITQRFSDATPFTGETVSLSGEGQSAPLFAGFKVLMQGQQKLTMVLISHRGEWSFKARATGPYEDALGVSLYAAVLFEAALMQTSD
jgi:hypothetical protein